MNTRHVKPYNPDVNTERERIEDEMRDLGKCRAAFGRGDKRLEQLAIDMLRRVPDDDLWLAEADVRAQMSDHVIDIALAFLHEIGSQFDWPGPDKQEQMSHAFKASDLLDLRLGIEGASALEAKVRELVTKSASGQLLNGFLARRRAEVK